MSPKEEIQGTCKCGHTHSMTLYRSIWGEYPENRKMVMQDEINVFHCPDCGFRVKIETSLMYTNADMFFAVIWEPEHDEGIDKNIELLDKLMGKGNYLSEAPRIKDWEEFKKTIIRFERGELKGKPPTKMMGLDF